MACCIPFLPKAWILWSWFYIGLICYYILQRVTSSQRMAESSVLDAHSSEVSSETLLPFIVFQHWPEYDKKMTELMQPKASLKKLNFMYLYTYKCTWHIHSHIHTYIIYRCMHTCVSPCLCICLSWCVQVELDRSYLFQIDGEPYWYYEYLVRKSPTKTVSVYISSVAISMQKYEHSVMVFNASIKISRLKNQTFIDIMLLLQLKEMVWPYYFSVLFFVIHV